MLASSLISFASVSVATTLNPPQRFCSNGLAVSNRGGVRFGSLDPSSSDLTSRNSMTPEVVDSQQAERPYGCRFRLLGRMLEWVTSQARRNHYEFKHLSLPQQWINIAARTTRHLEALETKYAKQMNRLTNEICIQQHLIAYTQRELDVHLAARDGHPEESFDPNYAASLMGLPEDSLEMEILYHQQGLAEARQEEAVLQGRRKELRQSFQHQFVETSQSLATLEKQFETMTGKVLRNPRKEYRALLMKDERTPAEEDRFGALAKEIWGETLIRE